MLIWKNKEVACMDFYGMKWNEEIVMALDKWWE